MRNRKSRELGHAGQIITTRKTIINFINDIRMPVTRNTVYMIGESFKGNHDYLRLYTVCARLYYLSKLVYWRKNEVAKLSEVQYKKEIFEPHAETIGEVKDVLTSMGNCEVDDAYVRKVFDCMELIEMLWSRAIACTWEQVYIPELAYSYDYVVKNGAELPKPEFYEWSFFPSNYEGYDYTEGIAQCFEEKMESIL